VCVQLYDIRHGSLPVCQCPNQIDKCIYAEQCTLRTARNVEWKPGKPQIF